MSKVKTIKFRGPAGLTGIVKTILQSEGIPREDVSVLSEEIYDTGYPGYMQKVTIVELCINRREIGKITTIFHGLGLKRASN